MFSYYVWRNVRLVDLHLVLSCFLISWNLSYVVGNV